MSYNGENSVHGRRHGVWGGWGIVVRYSGQPGRSSEQVLRGYSAVFTVHVTAMVLLKDAEVGILCRTYYLRGAPLILYVCMHVSKYVHTYLVFGLVE